MKLTFGLMFFLFTYIQCTYALTCSSQGTQLIYINGIWVENEREVSNTSIKIENTVNQIPIDTISSLKILDKVDYVHNISTGWLKDIQELFNQEAQIFNRSDRVTFYRQKLKQSIFSTNDTNQQKIENEEILKKFDEAVSLIDNKGQPSSTLTREELDSNNNKLWKIVTKLRELNIEAKRLADQAQSDADVTKLVKLKISKAITQNEKIIFVAHSQGNVVLKKAVSELESNYNEYMTEKEFLVYQKIFGSLHIANPSNFISTPVVAGGVKRSEYITLDKDSAIADARLATNSAYSPLSNNYEFQSYNLSDDSSLMAKFFNEIPFFNLKLPYFYTVGYHGMEATYLNPEITARKISSLANQGSIQNQSMPSIFNENLINVAEKLESSCETPTIKISINENFSQDPVTGVFKLSGYSGSERFVNVSATDLTQVTNDPDTEFTWTITSTNRRPNQKILSGKTVQIPIETNLENISVVVTAVNSFGLTSSKSIDLKVDADRPIEGKVLSQICVVNPSGYTSSMNRITFNYSDPDIVNDSHTFIEDRQETDPTAWFNISSPYAESIPQSFSFQSVCVPRFDLSLVEGPKCLNGKWIVKVSVDTTYISGLYADFNSSYISHYEGNPGMDGPITEEVGLGDGSPKFGDSSPVTAKIWIAANENVYKEISVSLPNVCR